LITGLLGPSMIPGGAHNKRQERKEDVSTDPPGVSGNLKDAKLCVGVRSSLDQFLGWQSMHRIGPAVFPAIRRSW
jgi:hypothetical protein